MKRISPSAERNRQPILEVLHRVLPPAGGLLLEIASGTGQHAVHFAAGLPAWTVQPSEVDPAALTSIAAYQEEAAARTPSNLRPPVHLDVLDAAWDAGLERPDAVFSANMLHIAPWECALGLLEGAGRLLAPGGLLIVYGPFMRGGQHTAPSNAAFDASLRQQDPRWGVRDQEAVLAEAAGRGLFHRQTVEMPANNLLVVLERR
jgi:SAM-dependent methyltransferase